jgi:RNA polymerase primary sigma factor
LEYKNEIDSIIRKLNIKEQVILHLRFGFFDGKQHSLLEVGEIFGITRERVRQIEAKVLNLLLDSKIIKNVRNAKK